MAKIQAFSALSSASTTISSGRRPLWEVLGEGQVLEISGARPGKLSAAGRLVARAMQEREPVAWLAPRDAEGFYPPDLVALGVDLDALVVVRMKDDAGHHGLLRAAEVLLRAGAFGLVVIDLRRGVPSGALSWQSRLSGLVRLHGARLVLLTSTAREASSVGPLISLRVEPELSLSRERAVLTQRTLKSKLGLHVDPSPDVRKLPAGVSTCTSRV